MADLLYFVGCMARFRAGEVKESTIKILKAIDIEFDTLDAEEQCCGSVLLRTGMQDDYKAVAKKNAKIINTGGWKMVITSCAGCYRMFTEDYPTWGYPLIPEILHMSEFILKKIQDHSITFKSLPVKVTYHDPCHLARHAGVYDAPREVLTAIPELELHEMAHHHEASRCCGSGAGVRASNLEIAMDLGGQRIQEALATEAEILVSTCPFCEYHLHSAAEEQDAKLRVTDLTELVAEAMVEG